MGRPELGGRFGCGRNRGRVEKCEASRQSLSTKRSLGLYLYILPTGRKSWRFKYRVRGNEQRMTFGLFPEDSLADARAKRDEARALIRDGRNPPHEMRSAKASDLAVEAPTLPLITPPNGLLAILSASASLGARPLSGDR
ncbi:Arm DNA-binding domain-containing protein [Sphingopyxis yananensis]|uniref:Arm DNA-binding domain-containing protein n=1 Tax=Sphingopyxis yananensis TaxID=2886687 RepID=UPI001D0FB208|nr:Arm DNA-binding domain-containing protein [Sphingopyxis yananensis]